jgi:4-diphosphocytidyl-2-C-methyl-D-erythritol kinase
VSALSARAPGKVNLCLYLGPRRQDGLHELVSLVQAVSLADELRLEPTGAGRDEVECPDVEGQNLAEEALRAYREAGWDGPPQRLRIDKRVPVAAGMGGGSGDAAAALRLAAHAAGRPDDAALERIAPALGADVPAALRPGLALVEGAGERVRRLEPLAPFALLVVALPHRLATAEVYREADRLGLPRLVDELSLRRSWIEASLGPGGLLPPELLHNDLEPAARSLCPAIEPELARLRELGALRAIVTGSGPTVVGLFRRRGSDVPGGTWVEPVGEEAGAVGEVAP